MLPSLVTLEEIKMYINVRDADDGFDAQLLNLAKNATKLLENYCRRSFEKKVYTEHFNTRDTRGVVYDLAGGTYNDSGLIDKPGVQRFSLTGYPIDADAPISANFDAQRACQSGTALAAEQFFIDPKNSVFFLQKGVPAVLRGLQVSYTAGYEAAEEQTEATAGDPIDYTVLVDAPEDLKMACVTQVVFMFNKYREGNIGIIGADRHSPEYERSADMLCTEARAYAAPYRRLLKGQK